MPNAANKFSGILLRLILVMSLAVPAIPAMASALNTESNSPAHEHFMNCHPANSTASDEQPYAGETAIKDHENCNDSCCPDSKCNCQGACLNLSVSNNLPLITDQNVTYSLQGEATRLSTVLDIHPPKNHYLPALRPPIC